MLIPAFAALSNAFASSNEPPVCDTVAQAAPTITSVSPNPVMGANAPQTLTINGSNFASGLTIRLRDLTNGGTFDKTTTSFSSTQVTISANFTTAAATWSAQAINPGGQASNQFNFTVAAPAATPTITSVSLKSGHIL